MVNTHQLLDCPAPASLLVSEGEREGPGIDTLAEEEPGPDGAVGMVDLSHPHVGFLWLGPDCLREGVCPSGT